MFWGGAFVAGKIAASQIGPFSIAFVRFFIASVLLVILSKSIEKKILSAYENLRIGNTISLGCKIRRLQTGIDLDVRIPVIKD